MKINIQIIAWSAAVIAVAAWIGIWYAGNYILDQASIRAAITSTAQQQSDKVANSGKLTALVADTQTDRDTLDRVTNKDIVSIVTMIEGVGKKAGVVLKVNNALPEGNPIALPGSGQVSTFGFVVEADGSFAELMRTVRMLETLPVPSSIEQLEFEHRTDKDTQSPDWHLSARVRVLTTSASS